MVRDRALVPGIVNVPPDSFSDGGDHLDPAQAETAARAMIEAGADLLDVGGESSRPGAAPVSEADELARVLPVVERLVPLGVPGAVDTRRAAVARAVLGSGAAIVNDITGLGDPAMVHAVREFGAGAVIMHMQGTPTTMQQRPAYTDVVSEVARFLEDRARAAENQGVPRECLVVDPGIGFGKLLDHNLALLAGLGELARAGYPVLVGASRKRFLGELTGVKEPKDRVAGSVAAAVAARMRGASVVRVHDVGPTRQALDVVDAIREREAAPGQESLL